MAKHRSYSVAGTGYVIRGQCIAQRVVNMDPFRKFVCIKLNSVGNRRDERMGFLPRPPADGYLPQEGSRTAPPADAPSVTPPRPVAALPYVESQQFWI